MNKLLLAAVSGLALTAAAQAAEDMGKVPAGKEKCYGIAAAGKNDCAAADGSHACAGLAKTANSDKEWKLVDAGSCPKLGGWPNPNRPVENKAENKI